MFIVIEGLDGVGKTTIGKSLSRRLHAKLVKTPPESMHLFHKFFQKRSPSNLSFLFYFFSVMIVSLKIRLNIKKNSFICVRYLNSTLAYHYSFNYDLQIRKFSFLIKKPDLQIFLILNENERKKRLKFRNKQSNIDLLTTISGVRKKILYKYYKNIHGVTIIDTTNKSVQEIVNIIIYEITNIK